MASISMTGANFPGGRSHVRGKAHDSPDSARARVRRGIKLLNERGPKDWRSKIDVSRLNIASPFSCVLGQVYGDFVIGLHTLNISGRSANYGFAHPSIRNGRIDLNGAWKSELRAR